MNTGNDGKSGHGAVDSAVDEVGKPRVFFSVGMFVRNFVFVVLHGRSIAREKRKEKKETLYQLFFSVAENASGDPSDSS